MLSIYMTLFGYISNRISSIYIHLQKPLTLQEEYELDLGSSYQELKDFIIDPNTITISETLGEGTFGKVKKAFLIEKGPACQDGKKVQKKSDLVAVKFLNCK